MPKMKTNRGAMKRFKRTSSGKIKFRRAFRSHILTKRSTKQKRHLRSSNTMCTSNAAMIKRMIGS